MIQNNWPALAVAAFMTSIGIATVVAFWVRYPALVDYLNQGAPI
jgi:hypothetical protein